MKGNLSRLSKKARWSLTALFAGLLCIASIVAWTQRSDSELLPCSNDGPAGTIDGVCVGGYFLVASYDALPKANQRELFRLQERLPAFESGFKGSVDSTGQFRIGGNWERRTNVVVDLESEATFSSPKNWPTVQTFLRDLGEPFYEAAKTKATQDNKASCDPTNGWTLLKLREEPLRRCLRTVFLLDMTKTFNDRTQKIFANQTIQYSDGTTAPLSLKRKGMTDSDRAKVVKAVKSLDKKARALGGYH